tara:strand:- start:752 stop:1210 length:459 start_codon:yes stop_codon:yes gene_type:complete
MQSSDSLLPPLDETIQKEVRELWPKVTWTNAMRQEWRRRLGAYDVARVLQALRNHYSENGGYPDLSKILLRLKVERTILPVTNNEEELEKTIEQEYQEAKEVLQGLSTKQKIALVETYLQRIGTKLSPRFDEWTKSQVMFARVLLDSLDGTT